MTTNTIEVNFAPRELTAEQKTAMESFTRHAGELVGAMSDWCPPGRETSLAVTKIEEALLWAREALTRPGNPFPEKKS
jgi:hypothetical protein